LTRTAFLVVDAGVEAELLDHEAAFVGAAGDADHAAAQVFGDLADRHGRPRRPRRHHHRLAGLRLADSSRPK
jgi:hypothetical protein